RPARRGRARRTGTGRPARWRAAFPPRAGGGGTATGGPPWGRGRRRAARRRPAVRRGCGSLVPVVWPAVAVKVGQHTAQQAGALIEVRGDIGRVGDGSNLRVARDPREAWEDGKRT